MLQQAFDAGKSWIMSPASEAISNANRTKYGFSKWWGSLHPTAHKRAGVTKAQALKAFKEGVAAGKRVERAGRKKNPVSLKSLVGKTVRIVKKGNAIIGEVLSGGRKRNPAPAKPFFFQVGSTKKRYATFDQAAQAATQYARTRIVDIYREGADGEYVPVGSVNGNRVHRRNPAPRKRNIAGFTDANGIFHPIRSGVRYGKQGGKTVQWEDKKKYSRTKAGEKPKRKARKTAKKTARKRSKR